MKIQVALTIFVDPACLLTCKSLLPKYEVKYLVNIGICITCRKPVTENNEGTDKLSQVKLSIS